MRLLYLLLLPLSAFASALSALYSTLDPTSVSEHFAFYELYPETPEGKKALKYAWELLSGGCSDCDPELILPTLDIQPIISLVNRSSVESAPILSQDQLEVIERLSKHLKNRSLKGFNLWKQEEILALPAEEIDLGRTLLLAELGDTPEAQAKIRSYEANLDLMALQIFARLPKDATPKQKIRAINDYVFSEMRFRFPPHSLYAKEIDMYTFLPAVLDSRRGVCLGVSILYLCLAQRLDLALEPITPPGHIYVRYRGENGEIVNIETTARGIDIPSEMYLGLETKKLQTRNLKEVVGHAFMNQAAVSWHHEDYETAVSLYEKASPFFKKDDYLLTMFLGFNYLFIGKEKEGRELLTKIRGVIPDHAITKDSISEDYLSGKVGVEGIQAIFSEVNEKRSSILEKQKKIEAILTKYPEFRQGVLHLAITWLQLGREKEALIVLENYIRLDPNDPTANYYLSAIHFQRKNFNLAWKYLVQAEAITASFDHFPQALKGLKEALLRACPKPLDAKTS